MREVCEATLEAVRGHFADVPLAGLGVMENAVAVKTAASSGFWVMRVMVADDPPTLYCMAPCPVVVPENRRREMAELLTRMNHGLSLGKLSMDFEDGWVQVEVNVPIGETPLTDSEIERIVWTANETMNTSLPAILRVIAGAEAKEAMEAMEATSPEKRGFWRRMGEAEGG